jgi:hypothetical protein
MVYLATGLTGHWTCQCLRTVNKQYVSSYGFLFAQSDRLKCVRLATVFDSALHYPDNDNFTIWDEKQQEVRPACRVEPSSATDVSRVLAILVDHWCYFAVKGGGHSRNPGDSNSVGGVTVDLNRMRNVEVLGNGTKARVGGGANTLQVFSALESQNLAFIGGRVGTVGVGGYTLGGGTSTLSNKYGWALDNVYEYEVRRTYTSSLSNISIIQNTDARLPRLSWPTVPSPSPPNITTRICTSLSVVAPTISALSRPSLFAPLPRVLSSLV